jgi:hypothetical protein
MEHGEGYKMKEFMTIVQPVQVREGTCIPHTEMRNSYEIFVTSLGLNGRSRIKQCFAVIRVQEFTEFVWARIGSFITGK